ncbi:hypothetical protein H8N03_15195 [Ramlibacter sp. USB13]|uniref:Uncharacterized protein n=1 Tax=Ramlibacter cellulosilyticus TaxID=2764187 RepID=A0A923MV39_9BURK|nr:hypothetical protein [Ramlibacter cellulosilyticus]MBC5784297.1 hypothetical protein [Ramlibacter cellulosilyticus]
MDHAAPSPFAPRVSGSRWTRPVRNGVLAAAALLGVYFGAHYLVNLAPVLGATGLVAFAAQFQRELFWVGLGFSAAGAAFVWNRLRQAEREHARCED